MNIEEANQVLQELNEVRPEMLNDKAKRLFEAIMLIANERDKANERVDKLINEVTIKDAEIEKKDKVIDMMAEHIEEWTGSCPNDMYDWQEIDCDKECEISMKKCWIEYFYNKVEISEEN